MVEPLLSDDGAGHRAATRLAVEPILWLTTVADDLHPHSVPVWFAWDDPILTIFSQPRSAKVRRIDRNPAVCWALDTADRGTDVVLGQGTARLAGLDDVRSVLPAFERKYRPLLGQQSMDTWLDSFAQPVIVTASTLTTWTSGSNGVEYSSFPRPGTSASR